MINTIISQLIAGNTMIAGPYKDRYKLLNQGPLICMVGLDVSGAEIWTIIPQPLRVLWHIGSGCGIYCDVPITFE